MLDKVPKNEKPQNLAVTRSQGDPIKHGTNNSTTSAELQQSKSRHDKGMELYKSGKVKVGSNGLFKVSGYYDADTEKMSCTCPDYRTRKEPCKHLFAAMLFVKNRGKQKIEPVNSSGDWVIEMMNDLAYDKPKPESKEPANKPAESPGKLFDRQATISTRLAVINSAIELLKTHRKPIEPADVISIAVELERFVKHSLR